MEDKFEQKTQQDNSRAKDLASVADLANDKKDKTDNTREELILVRLGEITLKGQNRGKFENQLMRNLRYKLKTLGPFEVNKSQSRVWVRPLSDDIDLKAAISAISKVFGLVSISPVRSFDGDLDEITRQAIRYVGELLADQQRRTFKVECRRGDKSFPQTSMEVNKHVGAQLLKTYPELLKVDVHEPDFYVYIEIRELNYIYHTVVRAQRGLPVGMSGRGMLLLSGGIDSPVAGYMMASRGMEIEAVYYHAHPFTSDQAKEKVIELARLLSQYTRSITLHIVNFTDIQLAIRDNSPHEMITIVMRRIMMRIAEEIATRRNCKALITGESLGQVASQTLEALMTTEAVVDLPVFRPLIGLDKEFIVQEAKAIDTYETSILPYEDCCTVFVAKHPKIQPTLREAALAEIDLDIEALVAKGLEDIEEIRF